MGGWKLEDSEDGMEFMGLTFDTKAEADAAARILNHFKEKRRDE